MLNPIERKESVLSALSTVYDLVNDRISATETIIDDYFIKSQDLSNDTETTEYNKEQIERYGLKLKTYKEILNNLCDMSEDMVIG